MKNLTKLGLGAVLALGLNSGAFALDINDPGVVGTVRSGEPASIANEVVYANNILALPANTVDQTIDGHVYSTSSTEYSGTVSATGAMQNDATGPVSVSGYTYVLAKYDGPNGGSVLFYLGGGSMTLPGDSSGLWVNSAGSGYGISHWTGFGPTTPPPPSVPDAGSSLALIGVAMAGLGFLRRKVS